MAEIRALSDLIHDQEALLEDAALALPHDFSKCTYSLGHIRQAVYLCLTCPEQRGICSACSIACHTEHEQIELFPKRHFRCDCPTSSIAHRCTLHATPEPENTKNQYGQNFNALFCRCKREYDATKERETMIQCLGCEDWFHESCLNLRERPPPDDIDKTNVIPESSRPTSGTAPSSLVPVTSSAPAGAAEHATDDHDDARSDASSSGLPPPLISSADYDTFVCTSCVQRIPILSRWAGTPGVLMVHRDDDQQPWRVIGSESTALEPKNSAAGMDADVQVDVVDDDARAQNPGGGVSTGTKRKGSLSIDDAREEKRPRGEPASEPPLNHHPCIAPPPNPLAQKILSAVKMGDVSLGTGDIFFTDDWRERWCRCSECMTQLNKSPYLLAEEETYEPPEDPDSGTSLEELGMRALARLPRDKAIEGIHAFNSMRDGLVSFLKPFAEQGKVVSNSDIEGFFEGLREGKA